MRTAVNLKTTKSNAMPDDSRTYRVFRRLGIVTIIAVYLLILAGGIVRSTGSGMGCPDWPTCFGSWVPPTDVSQLPSNYQQLYQDRGYADTEFNVYKTWTEYVNRLLGALIGVFIFFTLLASVPFLKRDPLVFYLSLLTFFLVGFQGWIGSVVVASNLTPWMITIHMLIAILIVLLLIYTVARSFSGTIHVAAVRQLRLTNSVLVSILVVSLLQILLGTQVREAIDETAVALGGANRANWVEQTGIFFYIHRSFSWVVLLGHVWLFYLMKNNLTQPGIIRTSTVLLMGTIVMEIVAGITLANFALPPFVQPIHLLLAIVAIGIQFALILFINYRRVFVRATLAAPNKQFSYQ